MKKTLSMLLICLIVLSTLSTFVTNITKSGSTNEYWREITVDNLLNPETLTNYQVFLNVTYDSDMQPDFDDLRFTWYNETAGEEVSIDYWLDKYVDSEYAIVWIEVPLIRGLGQETLYMYYGDSSAVSGSNGEETFVFFDGFSTDTTANYELVKQPGWVDGIIAWNSAEELLELTDNDPNPGKASYVWVRQKNTLIDVSEGNYWVETRGQISGVLVPDMFNVIHFYDYTGDNSTADGYYYLMASLRKTRFGREMFQIHNRWSQGVWEFYDTVEIPWYKDTWYRWGLSTISNGSVYSKLHDDNYRLIATLDNVTAHQNVDYWVGLGHAAGEPEPQTGLVSSYDYLRVRKFTDPEPSCSPGPEQLKATLDIDPDTLNLKSRSKWITCYIELPEGYSVSDVDVSTVMLNDTIPVSLLDVPAPEPVPTEIGDYDSDGIPDLMVKFDRTMVSELILSKDIMSGNVTLTVTGEVDGTHFEGKDSVRVVFPPPWHKSYKR